MKLPFGSLKNSRYMQYLAAVVATLSIASSATYSTWTSPSLIKLQSENSPIGVTISPKEASWMASSYMLGAIPGALITGYTVDLFGRRGTLLLCSIPLFLPWIAIVLAKSAMMLIIARFIAGIGGGIAIAVVPLYIGETAEKDIRGRLGTTFNVLKLSGSLFVLSVGPFVSYTALAISCSVFPLVFAILFYFMPESPHFLIKCGKRDEARKSLVRLSSNGCDAKTINSQLEEIENVVECDMKQKSTLWEFLSKQDYRKSLIIMFGVKSLQQLSGSYAIDAYMQRIIEESNSSISSNASSIIFGFVQIPAVLVASALVDRMGRKPLFIISALGCAIALTAEGVYFYFQKALGANVDNIAWLPTTALVLYVVMNPIGVFTLPYILLGELFATNIRGIAVSVATFYGAIAAFTVIKCFEPISEAWGLYTMFWIFASICILGTVFIVFVLPETKGKTFAEIQQKLNKNRCVQTDDVS